jgi:hypothetical protein
LTPAGSERRLLAQVNAILALGPAALERVRAMSLDADVPDPGRVFAALFVLGCAEGHRWLDPAHDIFLAAAVRNPNEAAAAIEAASLCPNSHIATRLAPLVDDERPRVRASVIRVLAFRGALSEAQWNNALVDSDLGVQASALSAPLRAYDAGACERALRPSLVRDDNETLTRLALRAGLSLGVDGAYVRAREIARTNPERAGAADLLALAGDLANSRVRDMLDGPHVIEGARAAAISGSPELVPDLLEVLNRTDVSPETRMMASQALATITGLGFTAVENATQALNLWSQHSAGFRACARYRHGRCWSPDVLLDSLRTGPGERSVRQDTYFELQVATQSRVPRFSAYDFVGVQAESLRNIERWIGSSHSH